MSSDPSSSELFQSPYFTSGFETASLLSSNPQTAFLSGDLFSQVVIPTPQTPNLELKFEVKVKFQGLKPHPIFHVSKIEHKTSPAPFEVVHIEFERDLNIPTITYGNIVFCNPYSGLKYKTSF